MELCILGIQPCNMNPYGNMFGNGNAYTYIECECHCLFSLSFAAKLIGRHNREVSTTLCPIILLRHLDAGVAPNRMMTRMHEPKCNYAQTDAQPRSDATCRRGQSHSFIGDKSIERHHSGACTTLVPMPYEPSLILGYHHTGWFRQHLLLYGNSWKLKQSIVFNFC